jgi:acetyl-CoA carboxylase biotin carboxyl carrier protein
MNLTEIQDLIKFVSKCGVSEVEIERQGFKITIKADPGSRRGRRSSAGQPESQVIQQVPMPMAQVQAVAPIQVAPAVVPAAAAVAPAVPSEEEKPTEDNSNYTEIKSPMIGTFYRSSSPDKPAFCEVGDVIKQGDVVCVIEAMKLFNEIESEVSGKIVKILVDDNTPVEYDQPLILVEPV